MKFTTTNYLILLVKNMLCSKLHCQKSFKLKHISHTIPFAFRRALPTETTVESGTSQSKSETSVNSSNSGDPDQLESEKRSNSQCIDG